ncbi:glutaredoxin 3 [Kiloniella sp. b19]|uniref:glutaredoxin 3 n=1 Tax=Kiloniella sp. GXU_MW_B19 TaxID=3141326 RepID=UPI0031D30F51
MTNVVMYSSMLCPFCTRAKKLLKSKGVTFEEIDVMMQPLRKREMIEKANGRRTVPQIFIGATHVGGCDDLMEMEADGKLDALLNGNAA